MESWLTVVQPLGLAHTSLHFDGLRISNALNCEVEAFCEQCSTAIKEKTGFLVKIREKHHMTMLEMLASLSGHTVQLTDVNECLLLDGNCIPCALGHLTPLPEGKLEEIKNPKVQSSVVAATRRARSYADTIADWVIEISPRVGMHVIQSGLYLIHVEDLGSPHCVAVRCVGDTCTVTDGKTQYTLKTSDLMVCASSAIDRQSIVTFAVSTTAIPPDDEKYHPIAIRLALMQLQAGARRRAGVNRLDGECVNDVSGLEDGEWESIPEDSWFHENLLTSKCF